MIKPTKSGQNLPNVTYNAQNVIAYIKLRYIILLDKLTKEASIKKSLSLEFSWLNVAGLHDKNQVFNENMHKITRESSATDGL